MNKLKKKQKQKTSSWDSQVNSSRHGAFCSPIYKEYVQDSRHLVSSFCMQKLLNLRLYLSSSGWSSGVPSSPGKKKVTKGKAEVTNSTGQDRHAWLITSRISEAILLTLKTISEELLTL
jgi:hypothetical protein